MLSFSISQSGMFRLMGRIAHLKPGQTLKTLVTEIHYESGVRWKQVLNAIGASVTLLVFIVLAVTKFMDGAWIVIIIIPLLLLMFHSISQHYHRVSVALSTKGLEPKDLSKIADVIIIPIADVHRGTLRAITYARRFAKDVRAICVVTSPEMKERLLRRWKRFSRITRWVKLITIDYDYRDVLTPVIDYIEHVNNVEFADQITTVLIPVFIPTYTVGRFLHNQTANRLRAHLRNYKDIVIIDVPIHIDSKI
jgi:hypothetical protein